MSLTRISNGKGPDDWFDEGPNTPHHFHRSYASVPAVTIPEMRPVIHAQYLENRNRVKPPSPLRVVKR